MDKSGNGIDSRGFVRIYSIFFILLGIWSIMPLATIISSGSISFSEWFHTLISIIFSIACFVASFGTIRLNTVLGYKLGLVVITSSITYLVIRILTLYIIGERYLILNLATLTLFWVLYIFACKLRKYFPFKNVIIGENLKI
ncbi:MAG TPA: hypothetical protein PKA63_11005 [Oligoflexia bacterium]|nr:hypothetical protein [Oligoflexia bacterium]HMP49186.1 hypothetical protein [Oligoflexia bacterium]